MEDLRNESNKLMNNSDSLSKDGSLITDKKELILGLVKILSNLEEMRTEGYVPTFNKVISEVSGVTIVQGLDLKYIKEDFKKYFPDKNSKEYMEYYDLLSKYDSLKGKEAYEYLKLNKLKLSTQQSVDLNKAMLNYQIKQTEKDFNNTSEIVVKKEKDIINQTSHITFDKLNTNDQIILVTIRIHRGNIFAYNKRQTELNKNHKKMYIDFNNTGTYNFANDAVGDNRKKAVQDSITGKSNTKKQNSEDDEKALEALLKANKSKSK